MNDERKEHDARLARIFPQLYFRDILRFPKEGPDLNIYDHIPLFRGKSDPSILNIRSFIKFVTMG